jgi:hypothetical protein
MPMTGIYRVQDIGEFHYQYGEEDKQEEILIGSVEELYNERKINRSWFPKENPFKVSKLEIWTKAIMILIDLHKNKD